MLLNFMCVCIDSNVQNSFLFFFSSPPFLYLFHFFLSSYFSHYFVLLMFCFIFYFFYYFFSPWVMVEFFLRDGRTIPWHVRSGWSSHWEFYRFLCLLGSTKVSPFVDRDFIVNSLLNSILHYTVMYEWILFSFNFFLIGINCFL